MIHAAMTALALSLMAAPSPGAPAPAGVQLAENNWSHGGQNQAFTNNNRQGVNCALSLNAAHPNCRNNVRSNSGGDVRGGDRAGDVRQLNLLNGPGGTALGGRGRGQR
jgi:hypothetical protein